MYPIFLPDESVFTQTFVRHAHERTLHGGLGLTMAEVRERFWVPRLRKLTKKIIKSCWGCKRFQLIAQATPHLVCFQKKDQRYQVPSKSWVWISLDQSTASRLGWKGRLTYIVLYACSLTRALHLEVLPNLETSSFLGSFKRLVACGGRPAKVFSDNRRSFVGAARSLKQVQSDEKVQSYLSNERITWSFNLSRAPWWGGQFERLIGLFKRSFYKTIGGGLLS